MAQEMVTKTRWYFHLTRDIDVPVQVRVGILELDILADDWREARSLQEEVAASIPCPSQTRGDSTQQLGDHGGARCLSVYVAACLEDDYVYHQHYVGGNYFLHLLQSYYRKFL